jgi:hypothetical protein
LQPNLASPIILLGAGASLKSGIPLSEQVVEIAAKWAYCHTQGYHPDDPSVKRSDWLRWLQGHAWYERGANAEDNYSTVLENLLQPRENRKEFFLRLLSPNVPASAGYDDLLEVLDSGRVHTVLTTNFDRVLPDLRVMRRRPHHLEEIRTPADYVTFSTSPPHPQLVYLHGSVEHYTDKNLLEEVQQLDKRLVALLCPLLRDHPLVVIGYRGAEPSVMHHLLLDQCGATNSFRQGIFWCTLSDSHSHLHPLAKELSSQIASNFQVIQIKGFDEAMAVVSETCRSLPRVQALRVGHGPEVDSSIPFDMKLVSDANLDELDWGRIQTQIVIYCRRMQIGVPTFVSREWLIAMLTQLDLMKMVDSVPKPTNAGYLLFAVSPSLRIPGAGCDVHIDGECRDLTGNLWSQRERVSEFFAEVNGPFRLKGTISEIVYPYPLLSLKELLVNALVHRSYDAGERLRVDIDEKFIRIVNPGGLVPSIFQRVNTRLQEEIALGRRGIKGYRNPVIADIFYGAGEMDKEGSGLPDVQSEVIQNEGKVFFGPVDEGNTQYRALIYRRQEEEDAETRTARPAIPKSRYFSNWLEIVGIPEYVWRAKTDCEYAIDVINNAQDRPFPAFSIKKADCLTTFSDLSAVDSPLEASINPSTIEAIKLSTLTETPDGRRTLVELLNQSLYRFLQNRGLCVDKFRKRAYFPRLEEGKPNEITYQASVRQATRTVAKPIASKRTERLLYWEHEAIGFSFENVADDWALQILPTYVFTKDGQHTFLDSQKVGPLTTRKSARDFNLQVYNDLIFWTWVMADGMDSFDLDLGDDLSVSVRGLLLGCELALPPVIELEVDPARIKREEEDLARMEDELAESEEEELDAQSRGIIDAD